MKHNMRFHAIFGSSRVKEEIKLFCIKKENSMILKLHFKSEINPNWV